MRRFLTIIALTALAASALSGCIPRPTAPGATVQRDIEAVSAVVFNAPGELVIAVGEPSLAIHGPVDVLDRISTESGDDLLVIAATGPGFTADGLRFELSLPAVSTVRVAASGDVEVDFSAASDVHVSIDGSGDLEGTGVDAETAQVSISGSGDVELEGVVVGVRASIDGSGSLDLEELLAQDGFVDISGSGDATVHATRMLSVDISGSGSVRHSGGAKVTTDISGSGEVVED